MIRQANKYDIDDIIRLLKDFASNSKTAISYGPLNWSKNEIEKTLTAIFAGYGFVLIDEKKTGILVAVKSNPLWVNKAVQLQEAMLYSPNKITMTKLVMEYVRIAKEMIGKGEVQQAVMYSYIDTDFTKIGLKKTQFIWEV